MAALFRLAEPRFIDHRQPMEPSWWRRLVETLSVYRWVFVGECEAFGKVPVMGSKKLVAATKASLKLLEERAPWAHLMVQAHVGSVVGMRRSVIGSGPWRTFVGLSPAYEDDTELLAGVLVYSAALFMLAAKLGAKGASGTEAETLEVQRAAFEQMNSALVAIGATGKLLEGLWGSFDKRFWEIPWERSDH